MEHQLACSYPQNKKKKKNSPAPIRLRQKIPPVLVGEPWLQQLVFLERSPIACLECIVTERKAPPKQNTVRFTPSLLIPRRLMHFILMWSLTPGHCEESTPFMSMYETVKPPRMNRRHFVLAHFDEWYHIFEFWRHVADPREVRMFALAHRSSQFAADLTVGLVWHDELVVKEL